MGAEQIVLWMMLFLMPYEITATNTADREQIKQQIIQIEIETRAHRQKETGRGL